MIQLEQSPARKVFLNRPRTARYITSAYIKSAYSDQPILPPSNLIPDPKYVLPPSSAKHGFLWFVSPANKKFFRLAPQLFCYVMAPHLPQVKMKGNKGEVKQFNTDIDTNWTRVQPGNYVSVKLGTDSAKVRLPLAVLPKGANYDGNGFGSFIRLGKIASKSGNDFSYNDMFPNGAPLLGEKIAINSLSANGNLPEELVKVIDNLRLAKCVFEIIEHQNMFWLLANFIIPKEYCQHMVNSPWLQIRPMDVHGPLFSWVTGRFGLQSKPPRFSIPLTKIAATLPPGGKPRLNGDDLLVDADGVPRHLPREVNNISRYDSAFSEATTRGTGECALRTFDDTVAPTMPPSQAIFVDWLNLKFAYTNTNGVINVMPLDRCQALNTTHICRILNRELTTGAITTFVRYLSGLGQSLRSSPNYELVAIYSEVLHASIRDGESTATSYNDLTLLDFYKAASKSSIIADLMQTAEMIVDLAHNNVENLYARYSVLTITSVVAYSTILSKYAKDYDVLKAKDREERKNYISQGIDSDFTPPALPFISNGRGYLPHQLKVTNTLRNSPDFAILPVDAGGGKTMLILTDILKEMNSGAVKRPLVMCPSHLVKDYVREFVDFTEGRVNVIPITSYTIRHHGVDGLFEMIKSAPINTVVVCDYNLANSEQKATPTGYGTGVSRVFPIVEMLRRFHFDYVACDESHYLKNKSSRQEAVHRLISDIPKRRLASGTMVADTIKDFPKQIGLLDPTIFGSQEDFIHRYAARVRGNKVTEWRPGAELEVMNTIKSGVVVAGAGRREWFSILPTPIETWIHDGVDLTPNQQRVYETILNEVVAEIETKIKEGNKALKKLFGAKTVGKTDLDDDSEGSDEDEEDDDEDLDQNVVDSRMETLLKASLTRLEQFVTDPAGDKLSAMLTGDDLHSPKVRKVIELCYKHINGGLPGKVLIFTNYKRSVDAIIRAMPADLRAMTIQYSADRKEECTAEFERNPQKKVMVGIEYSLNTGLNLQFASRLIRVETLWTPGAREQGDSRIGRPNVKVAETRDHVYYDWVMCNRTIDVTKVSYLIAKTLSKAKADNAGVAAFDAIEVPPMFPMSLDLLRSTSDADTALAPYFEAYNTYSQIKFRDYKQFRDSHPEYLDANGRAKITPIEQSAHIKNSKLMSRVPYVPGTELYRADDLGLVRYDRFLIALNEQNKVEDINEDDIDPDEDDDVDDSTVKLTESEREKNNRITALLRGQYVHTEYGDGEVIKVSGKNTIHVKLPMGRVVKVGRMSSYFITRSQTNSKDMRTLLLQQHGDLPMTEKIVVPANETIIPVAKKGRKGETDTTEIQQDDTVTVELDVTIVNDFLGLSMRNVDENQDGARALESFGFKHPQPYAYVTTKNRPDVLYNFAEALYKKGFSLGTENNEALHDLYVRLLKLRKNAAHLYGIASSTDLRNFYRMQVKPNPNPKLLLPYPIIQDNYIYIGFPLQGHPATKKAMQSIKVPNCRWYVVDSDSELVGFFNNTSKLKTILKRITSKGIVISNLKEINATLNKLKRQVSFD